MTGMDHAYVEARDLVESYLAGRLSEEEREAFEAHYFACETCLERLETADGLREGMRQVATEEIARAAATRVRLGLLAGLAARSRWRRLALGGALLLLLMLPTVWLTMRNRALQQRLAVAATGGERQRADLEARLHGLEQARAADRRQLAEELERQRRTREAAAQPQVNVPIFLLAAVRGGEEGRAPVNRLPLSSTAGPVILTIELATIDFPTYRASLHAAGGQEIWRAQGLRADSRDTLVLLLPAGMLRSGIYKLTIEGAKREGAWFAAGAYPFQVEQSL